MTIVEKSMRYIGIGPDMFNTGKMVMWDAGCACDSQESTVDLSTIQDAIKDTEDFLATLKKVKAELEKEST